MINLGKRCITRQRTDIGDCSFIDLYADAWNLTDKQWEKLLSIKPTQRETLFGHTVPREMQAYGRSYNFSGSDHKSKPMPKLISKMMARASRIVGVDFNMALINWYNSGDDCIGYHADDEREIALDEDGNTEPVACFSFGVTRKFLVKSQKKGTRAKTFHSESNSLLVMGGLCQKTHKHSIPRTKTLVPHEKYGTIRISVTFRKFK